MDTITEPVSWNPASKKLCPTQRACSLRYLNDWSLQVLQSVEV